MLAWGSLIKYLSHFSYLGVASYLGTIAYVIPIPEEAILMSLGYLAGLGHFNFWYLYASAVAGILIGDNIFYWLANRESRYLLSFKSKVKEDTWRKYEQLMENNIGKTLILLRFLIGFRFLGPVVAGSLKVKWKEFFVYDTAIVACYLGAFMYLGLYFHRHLLLIISLVEQFRNFLFSVVVIGLIAFLFSRLFKKTA